MLDSGGPEKLETGGDVQTTQNKENGHLPRAHLILQRWGLVFAAFCFVTLGLSGFVGGIRGCPHHLHPWFLLRTGGVRERLGKKSFEKLISYSYFTVEGTEP